MYKLEKRIKLEQDDDIEKANKKIDDLHHTLHTSICHINSLHNMSKLGLQDLEEARNEFKKNFAKENTVTPSMKEDVGEKTRISIEETEAEITAIRNALDVIQNIRGDFRDIFRYFETVFPECKIFVSLFHCFTCFT